MPSDLVEKEGFEDESRSSEECQPTLEKTWKRKSKKAGQKFNSR